MKILYLLQDLPYPLTNGVRVKVFNLIEYMSRQHECHIVSFVDIDSQSRALDFQKKIQGVTIIDLYPTCSGLNLQLRRFFHFVRGEPLFLARWWSDAFASAVRHALKCTKYDVVHIDALGMAPYVSLCRSLPTVISTTDAMSLVYKHAAEASRSFLGKTCRSYESKSVIRMEHNMLPLFSKVHVVAKLDRDHLANSIAKADVVYISHVVPSEVLRYPENRPDPVVGAPSEDRRILFTGALSSESNAKGLLDFLSVAYPLIYKKCPDVDMVILGGDASTKIKNKITQIPGVRFLEWVDDYYAELMKAKVLVYSDWSRVGVKTRMIYALALGKAVVATPEAVEGVEVRNETHCLVRNIDDGFAEAVISLLNDPKKQQTIGHHARKLILSKYSIDSTGPKWVKLYRDAIFSNQRTMCAESTI